ncbi:MAG: amino acid ABC transporter permease [Alphaproteobacteria bacterium]
MPLNFDVIYESLPFILAGVGVTLKFALLSLLGGIPLGIALAVFKISRVRLLRIIANSYTAIFRGTPLLVQLGIFFYATPQFTGYPISAFEAGVLTFSLNSAAYSSEIIRAGIESIDKGQWEASLVLGLTNRQTFWHIILPQAIRRIFPALINEMVDLLKESALISTIGEADLLRRAHIVASQKFLYFEPLIVAAVLYFIMVFFVGLLAKKIEKKYSYA